MIHPTLVCSLQAIAGLPSLRRPLAAGNGRDDRAAAFEVQPRTSSARQVLQYDPAAIAPDWIVALLAARGFVFSTAGAAEADAEPRLIDRLMGAIKGWAFDTLAEHLAFAIIGAIA